MDASPVKLSPLRFEPLAEQTESKQFQFTKDVENALDLHIFLILPQKSTVMH